MLTRKTRHLCLEEQRDIADGTGFVFRTIEGLPVFAADKKLNDKTEGKNKWKIGVSLSSGCKVGCIYCFTRGYDFYRPLNAEEICEQVDYAAGLPGNNQQDFDEVKVEMKQMGDPLINSHNTLKAISRLYSEHPGFTYVVSTSGPRNPGFFNELNAQRDKGASIRLQFSCHTTSNEERKRLSPCIKMMPLEEIAKAVDSWYAGEKATLNFIPFSGYELSAEKLASLFNPEHVFVKISYIDNNQFTEKLSLADKSRAETDEFVKKISSMGFACAYRNKF